MYESINDPEGIANSCRILGAIHADYLNYEKAVVYSQKAARIYEELKMETKRWQVLYNICIYKMDQGLAKDALKDLLDCLAFFRKTGNNYMVCRTLHRLGVNYLQLGKLSEGITSLDKARSFGYKTGDQVIIAECKCYTIEALVGKGDLVGADNLVVDLFSNPINNLAIETQTRVWKARGVLYAAQGRYKNAETDFKEAEKNAKEYELEYLLPDISIDWAKARLRAKKMAGAQELFGKARTIFQKYNLTIREVEMDGIISHAVEQPVFRNE